MTCETWSVIQPNLASQEAGEDGLAIKRMIAAGAGLPLHFLAEPESATRTTAESAGGPTFRHFEQRQRHFLWMLSDLARIRHSAPGAGGSAHRSPTPNVHRSAAPTSARATTPNWPDRLPSIILRLRCSCTTAA